MAIEESNDVVDGGLIEVVDGGGSRVVEVDSSILPLVAVTAVVADESGWSRDVAETKVEEPGGSRDVVETKVEKPLKGILVAEAVLEPNGT